MRHRELFKATAEHLVGSTESQRQTRSEESRVRGVDDFSPQGLGNMVWSFARQAQLGAESSNKENVATRKSGRMAVYSTCFFDLGEVLVQRLFHTIAEADLQVHSKQSVTRVACVASHCCFVCSVFYAHDYLFLIHIGMHRSS